MFILKSYRPSKEEKNAEEIARWDESKKWQKKLEVLKGKLAESDVEVSKLSKENKGKLYTLLFFYSDRSLIKNIAQQTIIISNDFY